MKIGLHNDVFSYVKTAHFTATPIQNVIYATMYKTLAITKKLEQLTSS